MLEGKNFVFMYVHLLVDNSIGEATFCSSLGILEFYRHLGGVVSLGDMRTYLECNPPHWLCAMYFN